MNTRNSEITYAANDGYSTSSDKKLNLSQARRSPDKRPTTTSGAFGYHTKQWGLGICFFCAQLIAWPWIAMYDPRHQLWHSHSPQDAQLHRWLRPLINTMAKYIHDPSPEAFVFAATIYSVGFVALYRLGPERKMTDGILLTTACLAIFLSFPALQVIKMWLPLMMTVAVTLSVLVNALLASWERPQQELK